MALFTTAAFMSLAGAVGWLGKAYFDNLIKANKEKNEKLEKENAERKKAALSFLGKDSDQYVGDDAPDVEYPVSPVEIMGNVAGGLLLPSTQVPDIDSSAIVASSFADIVREIEKINSNIQAIHGAMLASAIIESNYRQEVIADLEQAIADKDKARSQRRAGRRRDKVEDRKKFKVPGATFGNKLKRTLGQMAAITTAFAITEFIATVRDKGIGWLTGDDKKKTDDAEAGGIFTGPDSGYPVTLHGTELVIPLNNNVTDGISGNEVTSRGNRVSNIFKNGSSSFALSNKSNIFSSSPASSSSNFNSRISSIINSNSSTTIPVGDDQGSFTVIDMRTAQKLVNSKDGGSSISDGNEVITLSPQRRMSPYEPFVTRHV